MSQVNASTTHVAELQVHVSALEEQLSNPTKEQPAGGPTGGYSTNTGPTGSASGGAVATTSNSTLQNASQNVS